MTDIIPFFNNFAAFKETIVLESSSYVFQYNYNSRGDYWTMTISDTEDNILIAGVKVVLDYELITSWPGRNLPEGYLLPIDSTESAVRIDRNNLGDTVDNIYLEEDEVEPI